MQTEDVIERRAGCTCRIEPLEPRGYKVMGKICPFCEAWHLSMVLGSMEPLRGYGYGLERKDGEATADGQDGDNQAE